MSRSCVVVGAGVAGLSAAYRLANSGIRVTVIEGEPHIGGRTGTERVGQFVINTGASILTDFFDATLQLVRELRLSAVDVHRPPNAAATPFGKLPFEVGSPHGIWRFPLIPWFGKLRALSVFARRALDRRSHVADLASLARMDRGETVERWGHRVVGEAGYQYLLRPGVESFFYFGADEASAAFAKALMRHAARWEMLVLAEGMASLCDALAQRLEVRTGCWVGAVEAAASGVAVHHSGGTVNADYAVLALPATAAARLEGSISPEDREDLGAVRYTANIALFFGYERPITVQHASVTPSGPGRHPIAGVYRNSQWCPAYVPEGKELIAIYGSGWRSTELLERHPDKMTAALRSDAEDIIGRLPDPDWIRMYPRKEALVLPAPGHYRRMQAFLRRSRGRLLFAGDWLTGSTVEGAVRTGLQAAERILDAEK